MSRQITKIMLNGRSGSGKDTVADYLFGRADFHKSAFADPIRFICLRIFNNDSKEIKQDVGQKLREIDEDVWVNCLVNDVNEHIETSDKPFNIVVTDVRQENEYDALIKEGFIPVKIETDLENRLQRIADRDKIEITDELIDRIENHEAETGADDKEYKFILYNNGELKDLYRQVDEMLVELNVTNAKGDPIRRR